MSPKIVYIKIINPDEMKKKAFEICGQRYKVLSYENDTAKIQCIEDFRGCEKFSSVKANNAVCNEKKWF